MHFAQSMAQRSVTRNTMMLLTAIMLITAVATDATAAERDGGGGGMGEFRGGHLDGGFSPPLLNSVLKCRPGSLIHPLPTLSLPRARPPSRRQVRDLYLAMAETTLNFSEVL